ncbi:MAG: PilZ domain-containing protein [Terriglobales bacterium]
MDETQQDRRRAPRVSCRVPVTLRSSDGRDIAAVCLDINQNGVGIETHNQLTVGQRLQLLVPKKDGDVTPVPMLVMFRMNTHYGLSALDAQERVLDLIPTQA